jgi:dolichyl-phosphate-mannose-protein mannosyltransferase
MDTTEAADESQTESKRAPFDLDLPTQPAGGLAGWLGPLAVTVLAALLRLPNLGRPHAVIFDETYYVKDSLALIKYGHEQKVIENADAVLLANHSYYFPNIFTDGPSYIVHPPVGKWIISIGELAFGANPFGWRIAVAVLGILSVLLTARIARRLTNSNFIGTVAGFLLAIDGLHIVMSRTALLDTSLSFFALCAFGFLIIDRDSANSGKSKKWRWAMVAALGLACATKWSGLYFAVAFGTLMLVWDYERRTKRLEGIKVWLVKDFFPALAMPFAIIAIYISSWVGWFRSAGGWNRNWAQENHVSSWLPDSLVSLLHYHKDMLSFHTHLVTPHSYASNPWTWPLMIRPTSFFYETAATCGTDSCSQEVIPLGNPLIWWTGVVALLVMIYFAVARRHSAALPIAVAFAAGWVPWLFFAKRTTFSFYSVAFVPYTVMALAILLYFANTRVQFSKPIAWRWPTLVFLLVAVELTLFFYPILTGQSIPYDSWHMRMWLRSWI